MNSNLGTSLSMNSMNFIHEYLLTSLAIKERGFQPLEEVVSVD
jgi:hypothetical protein